MGMPVAQMLLLFLQSQGWEGTPGDWTETGWFRDWQLSPLNSIFSLKSKAESQGSERFWMVEIMKA